MEGPLWMLVAKGKLTRESGQVGYKFGHGDQPFYLNLLRLTFGVYNGHKHIPVSVSEDMIGQKFGEYSQLEPITVMELTRKRRGNSYHGKRYNPRRGRRKRSYGKTTHVSAEAL